MSLGELIERALAEDVGEGDLTTAAVVPEGARARGRIEQKAPGVVAGLAVAEAVFERLDPELRFERRVDEGEWREGGPVAEIEGAAAPILTGERVALNFLGRLSGVATLTARYVKAVEGTGVTVLDTRKTTPGLRALEKEAVRAGGGTNHRAGLYDALLIKENHSALAGGVGQATRRALERRPRACPWRWSARPPPRWRRRSPPEPGGCCSTTCRRRSCERVGGAGGRSRPAGGLRRRDARERARNRRDRRGLRERGRPDALGAGARPEPDAGARVRAALAAALALAALPAPACAAFPQSPPNDPLFDASPLPNATNEQWDLAAPAGGFDRGISVERAWPLTTGRGVVIADIDVGVQLDHPDLAGRWYPGGYDFWGRDADPTSDTANAHGTNVAGVLGAAADNGRGIAGIAPGSAILPVRTSDNILHQSSRLAEGIVYATDHGARVASMSLGTDSVGRSLRRAVAYAERKGTVMVAASGNEFHFHHEFPATFDEVIAVGGLNPDTANAAALQDPLALAATDFTVHASYADYGPHLDLVAPTQVPTTEWGGGYKLTWSGTSAATPHVAGVAALVLARAKALGLSLSAGEVRQLLIQTADDLADPAKGYAPGWDRLSGWGRVNALRAVERVARGRIPPNTDIDEPQWYAPMRRRFAVRGLVAGRSPTHWTLELGRGEQPGSWRTIGQGGSAKRGRRLAVIDPARLEARRLDAAPAQRGRPGQRRRGPPVLLRAPRPLARAPLPARPRHLGRVLARAGQPQRRPGEGDRPGHFRRLGERGERAHGPARARLAAADARPWDRIRAAPDRRLQGGLRRHARGRRHRG